MANGQHRTKSMHQSKKPVIIISPKFILLLRQPKQIVPNAYNPDQQIFKLVKITIWCIFVYVFFLMLKVNISGAG